MDVVWRNCKASLALEPPGKMIPIDCSVLVEIYFLPKGLSLIAVQVSLRVIKVLSSLMLSNLALEEQDKLELLPPQVFLFFGLIFVSKEPTVESLRLLPRVLITSLKTTTWETLLINARRYERPSICLKPSLEVNALQPIFFSSTPIVN